MKVLLSFNLILFFLSGCASIRAFDKSEKIVIRSNAEDVEVYRGKKLLGETPLELTIPRKTYHQELTLKRPGYEDLRYPLNTEFRWGYSGVANLFLGFPISLGIDLYTERAWRLRDLGKVRYESKQRPEKIKTIAIAPPQTNSELFSDQVGEYLIEKLKKKYPQAKIVSLEENAQLFDDFTYFYDNYPDLIVLWQMREKLNATHLFESQVRENFDGQLLISGELTTNKTKKHVKYHDWSVSPTRFKTYSPNWLTKWRLYSWVPNSLSLDFVGQTTNFSYTDEVTREVLTIKSTNVGFPGDISKFLNLISGIGLTNVSGRGIKKGRRFRFALVPSFQLNHSRFRYDPIDSNSHRIMVTRFRLGAGYGPQMNMHLNQVALYLELIPILEYSDIQTEIESLDDYKSYSGLRMTAVTELGARFIVHGPWSLKVYLRLISEDEDIFLPAIRKAFPLLGEPDDAPVNSFAGFSVSYDISGFRNGFKKWGRRD